MEILSLFIDVVLNLDVYIPIWIQYFGPYIYVILFLIIFAETGLIVTPFLPGDSLLFALGAMTALEGSGLSLWPLVTILIIAAIIGDSVNYSIGKYFGPRVFRSDTSKLFNKDHLIRTQKFYEKYGASTIIIARFAPIIRTFAPFVAGIGRMHYPRFFTYNVVGALVWVLSFTLAGNYFGNLPVVKRNFHIIIFAIIIISLLPSVFSWIQARRDSESKVSV